MANAAHNGLRLGFVHGSKRMTLQFIVAFVTCVEFSANTTAVRHYVAHSMVMLAPPLFVNKFSKNPGKYFILILNYIFHAFHSIIKMIILET